MCGTKSRAPVSHRTCCGQGKFARGYKRQVAQACQIAVEAGAEHSLIQISPQPSFKGLPNLKETVDQLTAPDVSPLLPDRE
jgi:hypothetical protein